MRQHSDIIFFTIVFSHRETKELFKSMSNYDVYIWQKPVQIISHYMYILLARER